MKRIGTAFGLLCLLAVLTAQAQPVRNGIDVIWARDVAGAEMTLDGQLDEEAWQQATKYVLKWNETTGLPGSGQRIEGGTATEPPDPNDGVLYVLRDGNFLWFGIEVNDKSVGGGRGLQAGNWDFDGFIASFSDPSRRPEMWEENFGGMWLSNAEFIYGWWHPADTSDATTTYSNGQLVGSGRGVPGIAPYVYGNYGVGWDQPMDSLSAADLEVWSHATTVDGIANDDTHGEDVGYTTEWRIDVSKMGYDFTQPGGDKIPFNFALQDTDYRWPVDNQDNVFTSRVWFQNQWANNFAEGVGYIYGEPGVNVGTEVPQVTTPDVLVPSAQGSITVDGSLDESDWGIDPQIQLQYQPSDEIIESNPEPYQNMLFFFRALGSELPILDPSIGRVKMLSQGNMLYVALDVEDQAINGTSDAAGADGFRITIRTLDSLKTVGSLYGRSLEFTVDSTGALRYGGEATAILEGDPTAIQGAVALKGASTAADPSDIDEGYTMEVAIDLTKIFGYPEGLGDGRMWFDLAFFDGDFFEDEASNYATFAWIGGERLENAVLYAWLASSTGTAAEPGTELPDQIALYGNYPNPFNPSTTLRFALPQAGEVTVHVFDVLGRQVSTLNYGFQPTGPNEVRFDASSLASGLYLYRVQVASQVGTVQSSTIGRMMLIK